MISGVILAGGKNTRMKGIKKALLPFNGNFMIERQIEIMKPICEEVMVVVNEPSEFVRMLDPVIRIISDPIPGQGPFSAIYAALSLCTEDYSWVVGCDQPYISQEVAGMMLKTAIDDEADAVIPLIGGEYRFVHAVYHKRCLEVMRNLIGTDPIDASGKLDGIRIRTVTEEELKAKRLTPLFAEEFNTMEQYKRLLEVKNYG